MTAIGRASLGLAAVLAMLVMPAQAADKLRVGKAVPQAFSFTPVDIGARTGIFAKQGLDVEIVAFVGDARMQQPRRRVRSMSSWAQDRPWRSSPRALRSRASRGWRGRRC